MKLSSPNSFSIAETRAIVADLFTPNPLIYWVDFLISAVIGYTCAVGYVFSPIFSAQQIICLVVAGFALHRVDNFIHEISHFRTDTRMRSFVIGWNVLAGVPTLMPSFFFDNHLLHHRASTFGTNRDCEYVPLARGRWRNVVFFVSEMFMQPIFVIIRFTIVTPISFLHPAWRQWVLENFSSFVFVWPCRHEVPKDAPRLGGDGHWLLAVGDDRDRDHADDHWPVVLWVADLRAGRFWPVASLSTFADRPQLHERW